MIKFKERLIKLHNEWVQSRLNREQFAKKNGLTDSELDIILTIVQSWDLN